MDYYGKASLRKSQHTFYYADKYVELSQQPNTTSPKFPKKGGGVVIYGRRYTLLKIILYTLVLTTINEIGLAYINDSRCGWRFKQ